MLFLLYFLDEVYALIILGTVFTKLVQEFTWFLHQIDKHSDRSVPQTKM